MTLGHVVIRGGAAAAVAMSALAVVAPAGRAGADDCPNVEVVFARGTGEPPGVGRVGQAFIDALTPLLGGRTVGIFSVNYPASVNFLTTAVGAGDAAGQIANMVGQCPYSRLVLGGFSQGAAVVAMLAGVAPLGNTVGSIGSSPPLPPQLADKVSAVAVFGNPSARFGAPLSTTGLFAGRAIDLCNPDDPICSSTGSSRAAHNGYEFPPSNEQAAGFVAGFL
jgi:cutinase